ncbi:MAG: low molecular weight protein-tyrosine-phosphatase [Oscillochloridaceae bacterium umkhey_bin13]
MQNNPPIKVLFVCMGNICRSPMAEAVFRHQVAAAGLTDQFVIDSAGTGGWHAGEPPHHGTQAILQQRGVAVGDQRARQVRPSDLHEFDYVLAMDDENLRDLRRGDRAERVKVHLLLEYAPDLQVREVPDPYYSGGFGYVYDLVEAGCAGLLSQICNEHEL